MPAEGAQLYSEYRNYGMHNRWLTGQVNNLSKKIHYSSTRLQESPDVKVKHVSYCQWKEMLLNKISSNSLEMQETKTSYKRKMKKELKSEYGTNCLEGGTGDNID